MHRGGAEAPLLLPPYAATSHIASFWVAEVLSEEFRFAFAPMFE